MKVRIVFKGDGARVYDDVSVNWNMRVVWIYDDTGKIKGFVPFEAISSLTKL